MSLAAASRGGLQPTDDPEGLSTRSGLSARISRFLGDEMVRAAALAGAGANRPWSRSGAPTLVVAPQLAAVDRNAALGQQPPRLAVRRRPGRCGSSRLTRSIPASSSARPPRVVGTSRAHDLERLDRRRVGSPPNSTSAAASAARGGVVAVHQRRSPRRPAAAGPRRCSGASRVGDHHLLDLRDGQQGERSRSWRSTSASSACTKNWRNWYGLVRLGVEPHRSARPTCPNFAPSAFGSAAAR